MDNNEVILKLQSFLNESYTFSGIVFQGMYTMSDNVFMDAFLEYLESGENHLDEYTKFTHLGWDLGNDIIYSQSEIDEYKKYINNKRFWNVHALYNDIEIKEIDLMLDKQQLRINEKELLLEKTDYRNTIEYRNWRKAVFEKDNYTCQECKQKGGKLQAHHILSFKKHPKKRYKVNNGETLCVKCHRKKHSVNE